MLWRKPLLHVSEVAPCPYCKGDDQKRPTRIDSKVIEFFEHCQDVLWHDDKNDTFNWRWMSADVLCPKKSYLQLVKSISHLARFSIAALIFWDYNKWMGERTRLTLLQLDAYWVRYHGHVAMAVLPKTSSATLQRLFLSIPPDVFATNKKRFSCARKGV